MTSSFVSLHGGLGNQLFQYFFLLFVNEITGSRFVLDDTRQEKVIEHPNSRLTQTILIHEKTKVVRKLDCSEKKRRLLEHLIQSSFLRESFTKRTSSGSQISRLGTFYEVEQTQPMRMQSDESLHRARRVVGYFQSAHYFDYLPTNLKNHFHQSITEVISSMSLKTDGVGLHLRRGDFRTRPDLGLIGTDRYLEVLKKAGLDSKPGFLFSDEPDCEEAKEISSQTALEVVRGLTPLQTLAALARCPVKVIANSSLSFAAAVLSPPTHEVFAPLAGLGHGLPQGIERYRPDWLIF